MSGKNDIYGDRRAGDTRRFITRRLFRDWSGGGVGDLWSQKITKKRLGGFSLGKKPGESLRGHWKGPEQKCWLVVAAQRWRPRWRQMETEMEMEMEVEMGEGEPASKEL
jgi:hypothetical protein